MHDECEEAFPYMCKKTPGASGPPTPAVTTQAPGNCPKGWFVWGNKCYHFFPELGNWDEARNICRSNDGDLATIRNRDEQCKQNDWVHNIHLYSTLYRNDAMCV